MLRARDCASSPSLPPPCLSPTLSFLHQKKKREEDGNVSRPVTPRGAVVRTASLASHSAEESAGHFVTALERTETPLIAPGVVQPDPHGNHCTLPHLKLPRNPKIYISGYDSGRIQTCIVAHYSATQTLSRTRGLRASPTLTFRLVKS